MGVFQRADSPGGAFGDALYVSDITHGSILKIDANGVVSTLATGFIFSVDFIDTKIVFSPDGNSLYITENTKVVELDAQTAAPEPSTLVLATIGGMVAFGLRRRSKRREEPEGNALDEIA